MSGPIGVVRRRLDRLVRAVPAYRPRVRLTRAAALDPHHRVHAEPVTLRLTPTEHDIVHRAGQRRIDSSRRGLGFETDLELGVPTDRALEAIGPDYQHVAVTVGHLADVVLERSTGASFARYGLSGVQPLVESFLSWRLAARYRPPAARPGYGRISETLVGPHLSLLGPRATHNLYHFLIELLPRALCVDPKRNGRPVTLLVPADRSPFWDPFLDALSRSGFAIRAVGSPGLVRVEELLAVDLGMRDMCGYVDPAAARRLRALMVDTFGEPDPASPTRIYISRAGAARRRMVNEDDLVPALIDRGFTIVRAEDLSYGRQVHLFAGAEVVAGPHGAGLTNLIHTRRGEVVVSQSTDHTMPHYLVLARALGLGYHHVEGPMVDADLNFTVDPAAFLAGVDAAIDAVAHR